MTGCEVQGVETGALNCKPCEMDWWPLAVDEMNSNTASNDPHQALAAVQRVSYCIRVFQNVAPENIFVLVWSSPCFVFLVLL